jgi:hypothetical protein
MKKFYTTLLLLLFAVSMMYGQNLVTNPGFENWTGGTPNNWTYESGVTFNQESTNVHNGTYSAMVTLTTDVQGDTDTQNAAAAVVAGDPYNCSVWVYDNDPAGRVSIVLYWTGGPANTYTNVYSEDIDAWQELTYEDYVPEGATEVKVGFRFYDVAANWDGDAIFYVDDYSFEINTTVYPEPTNYPTDFLAESEGPNINLSWTDAIGDQLPRGYLILGNNDNGDFTPPVDGVPVPDDLNWDNNNIAVNVMYGAEMLAVSVEPNKEYNFTIYPYSNTAEDIDYKTDGTPPVASASSGNTTVISLETFDSDLGEWTGYNVSGEQVWGWDSFGLPPGCAKMNGYAGGAVANEDWLISPALNLSGFETITFSFDHARNFASNEGLFVLVSTDYDGSSDPSTNGTWADLTSMFTFPEGGGSWDFIPAGSADVSMYDGTSTYFAYKYTSTDVAASTWEIDNALISGVAAVGIAEIEEVNIQVYPNPATDMLTVHCESQGNMKIISLAGQVMMQSAAKKGANLFNVQRLNPGMYMLQFTNEAGAASTQKLLIK